MYSVPERTQRGRYLLGVLLRTQMIRVADLAVSGRIKTSSSKCSVLLKERTPPGNRTKQTVRASPPLTRLDARGSRCRVERGILRCRKAALYRRPSKDELLMHGGSTSVLWTPALLFPVTSELTRERSFCASGLSYGHVPQTLPLFSTGGDLSSRPSPAVEFSRQQSEGVASPKVGPTSSQLSFVLLKLRDELPHLFYPHYHLDTYIYTPDVLLENQLLRFLPSTIRGVAAYRFFIGFWQRTLGACYAFPELQLVKITKEFEKGEVHARWRICGYPRSASQGAHVSRVVLDGFSEFAVNSSGLIYCHKISKVMPSPKVVKKAPGWWVRLGALLGWMPRQKPLAPECIS